MKYFFIILLLFTVGTGPYAQEMFTDPKNVFVTNEGVKITGAEAKRMLYNTTQKYELKRKPSNDGKTIIQLVPVTEKEYWKNIEADQKTVKKLKGTTMISYELLDKEGQAFTNAKVAGKLTVYNFWFTGCRPCLTEIPQLNELVATYGDQVNFVAPTFESQEKVDRFLSKRSFQYQIMTGATKMVSELRITSYPTHLLVDENGVIQQVFIGKSETIGKLLDKAISARL